MGRLIDRHGGRLVLAAANLVLAVGLGALAIVSLFTVKWTFLIFMAVVVWIKWPVGWGYSRPGGGWEYPMLWLVAQASLVLAGSGAFALHGSRS